VLGTFLEGFAMLVLTLPIVHPLPPIWLISVIVAGAARIGSCRCDRSHVFDATRMRGV